MSLGGSDSKYASHCREVINLINKFRATGAHFGTYNNNHHYKWILYWLYDYHSTLVYL